VQSKKFCNAVHGKKKYALYEALSVHLSLVSLGWQDVAGAGCTGWTSSTVFFVGAPVLAAQVSSQWGEHSGPSQSFGHFLVNFSISFFCGGVNFSLVFARLLIAG